MKQEIIKRELTESVSVVNESDLLDYLPNQLGDEVSQAHDQASNEIAEQCKKKKKG